MWNFEIKNFAVKQLEITQSWKVLKETQMPSFFALILIEIIELHSSEILKML